MPPFADLDETQRLDDGDDGGDSDSDSDSSRDPMSDDDYVGDQCTVPIGDTLAIETEGAMEDSILYGETQAVDYGEDGDDSGDENGFNDLIETQAVGDSEGEIGDDGIEETEIDDGDDGDEARVLRDGVDSDASTDDEGTSKGAHISSNLPLRGGSCKSSNGSVRSIAAVRAAALRSSGLAAAQSIRSKAVDESQSSFGGGEKCINHDNVGGQMCANGTATWPNRITDLTVPDTKVAETARNHETENSQKGTLDYHRDESRNRTNNPVVKKLFYELTSAEEQTTCKPNRSTGQMDYPGSLNPNDIAGLSYVGSQEPGDLSQANALDVVDKFLVVNYLGLSQEANTGKSTDMAKSPPISSAKGAQQLAKKTDHRSQLGKPGTFEWIDNLEDEGGGEFFTKRKESFFTSKDNARKSRSQPPKSRSMNVGLAEDANPKNHRKVTSCSDSRSRQNRSLVKHKVHVAETRRKKNLFKDLNEQSKSKSLDQQLELTDVDRGEKDVYEYGPDTQMAAEAMEALVHASPINNETKCVDPAPGTTKIVSEGTRRRTTTSKRALSRNATSSTPNPKGDATRSKQRNVLPTNSKQSIPICHKRKFSGEKSSDCTIEERKSKRGKKKIQQTLNARSSVCNNEFSVSFKGEKEMRQLDRILTKGSDACSNSLTVNVQFSVGKELIQGEFHVNSTPIAHRTRHSKATRSSKTDVPTDRAKDKNSTLNVKTRGTIARENKLVANTGELRETKRKSTDFGLGQSAKAEQKSCSKVQDIEGVHGEEARAGSSVGGIPTHPKRRRTRQTTPDNQHTDSMKNESLCDDGKQVRTRQRMITASATIKSVAQILDAAKRKRRSVFTRVVSEIDGLTSDSGKAMFISGMRTRSSLKYSPSEPNVGNASMNCSSRTIINTSSTDKANLCSTPPLKQGAVSKCQVEIPKEKAKPEESPKGMLHPSIPACMAPSKDANVVSPVCVAEGRPITQSNSSRSQSLIARELIRLEASKSSPTSMFSTRKRKDMASVRVLFSHHLDDDIVKQQKKIMGRLGVSLAFSISDATHFVTDNFVRTRNMLEAMALGKPVVTHMWLESCGQASCFIDEKNYILRDAKKEKEIGFSMPVSLAHACQNPLLLDRRVYITPNTKPGREVISSLVKAAHGQPLERIGRSAMKDDKIPDDLLVLSCEEDYSVCIPLLEKGAEIFSSELLLNGIVIQKLEYERHRLFLDHVKRTRSTIWLRREDGNQFLPVTKCA